MMPHKADKLCEASYVYTYDTYVCMYVCMYVCTYILHPN